MYRSKQRGFLELDLVLGKWVEEHIHSLDENGIKSLVSVLDQVILLLCVIWLRILIIRLSSSCPLRGGTSRICTQQGLNHVYFCASYKNTMFAGSSEKKSRLCVYR